MLLTEQIYDYYVPINYISINYITIEMNLLHNIREREIYNIDININI
jgi:hypothetical protein